MIYSSLDLAAQSGTCWGEPNTVPSFETWHLGSQNIPRGQRGRNLMQKLAVHIEYVKPDLVFIEAPLPAHMANNAGTSEDTTIVLNGYVLIAEAVCFAKKVPTRLIKRQDALKHFTGRATYPAKTFGKDAAKKACMSRATQLRWVCANWDEADAGAQWHYGCALENPNAYLQAAANEPVRARTGKTRL